ncbi:MAG TPA: hypothetical protein VGB53_00475 [Rubricoccaceae bacterium]|jgi:hypothetical protein
MATSVPRSSASLADAIDTFVAALGGAGKDAGGLPPDTFADLTGRAATLREALGARATAEKAFRAAIKTAETAHDAAEDAFRPARRQANNHAGMTDALRAAAGLGAPVGQGGPGAMPAITDLTAVPRPSGSVFLDWSGPSGGSLRYEVFEAALGAASSTAGGTWRLVGSASATDFTVRDAVPGARSAYRVEAVRGERRGEPSNEAAVYA